jgi:hypothetical protein
MSKRRDPIVLVFRFFQEVELPIAQQALSVAAAIVKARTPSPRPRPVPKKAPLAAAAGGQE